MSLHRLVFWGLVTGLYFGLLIVGSGTQAAAWASNIAFVLYPLAAAATVLGTRRHVVKTAARRAWAWIAAALATWSAASAVWAAAAQWPGLSVAADAMYVAYAVLLLVGVAAFPLGDARLRARQLVRLDVIAVAVGVVAVQWIWVGHVYASMQDGTQLLNTAWLTLNAFAMAVLFVKAPRRQVQLRWTWGLLTAGVTCVTTADALYHLQLVTEGYASGGPLDVLWAIGFLLVAGGAMARRAVQVDPDHAPPTGLATDVVVYGILFTAGAAIVWRAATDGLTMSLIVSAAALSVISVIRQVVMAADHSALTRRLQAASAELAALLESYETSLQVGRMSAWEWRAATDELRWSPHAEQILSAVPSTYAAWREMVHPDDRAVMRQRLIDAGEGVRDYSLELRIIRPDGALLWVAVGATVVRDEAHRPVAMVGTLLDITDRKISALELQKTTALLEHVMTASPIHTFAGSVEGGGKSPHYISENIERLLGGSVDEYYLPDRRWENLVHPEDLAVAQESNKRALETGYSEHEVRMRHRAGHYLWFRTVLRVTPAVDDGPRTYVGCMIDVTASRSTEQQLRQAQKMEAVGQLAGGFAHDFNNLLTAIGGYAEQAQLHSVAGGPAESALSEVLNATRQAAVLIDQLMTFSRRQDVRPADVDVSSAVSGMEGILRTSVGEAVQLRVVAGGPGRTVKLPPGQLEQLLLNLAVNARDAMPGGGVLTITAIDVELGIGEAAHRGVPQGRYVELAVADTGSGMSAETRSHAFEPFFTTKAPGSGTGLGLPMVYGIVTQAGGAITIDSALGHGTTVTALLPLFTASNNDSVPAAAAAATVADQRQRACTILLVEDQPQVRALVASALEREGHTVLAAGDGLEALAAVEMLREPVDLILTDIVMPGMGGVELAEQLANSWPDVPVLFMSGYADVAPGSIRADHGFLRKPFSIAELTREVQLRLPRRALGAADRLLS